MSRKELWDVLTAARAEDSDERILVLGGPHETRVSVISQQVRAINLATALYVTRKLQPDEHGEPKRIAVVGAGAGGTTFAAAASLLGARVTLFDEHEEPISTQRWSFDRFLHPNLFDWPDDRWHRDQAELPVMDWSAAPSARVRLTLLAGFARAATASGRIAWCPQHVVTTLEEFDDGVRLLASDLRTAADDRAIGGSAEFAYAVVATGFLPEESVGGADMSGSYWKDVDIPALTSERVCIVGDGDGALTELLCLTVCRGRRGQKQHKDLLEIVAAIPEDVRLRVGEIESRMLTMCEGSLERYSTGGFGAINTVLRDRAQSRRRQVRVHAMEPALKPNSFPINRVLASQLATVFPDDVQILTGDPVEPEHDPRLKDSSVVWRKGPRERKTTRLATAILQPKRLLDLMPKGEKEERQATRLINGLVDGSRRLWHDVEPELAAALATAPADVRLVDVLLELEGASPSLDSRLPHAAGWRPPVDDDPAIDVGAIVAQLARLAIATGAEPEAPGAAWWSNFEIARRSIEGSVTEVVDISLDVVAAACDLTPAEVIHWIKAAGPSDVSLAVVDVLRSEGVRVRRLWVRYALPTGSLLTRRVPVARGRDELELTLLSLLLAPAVSEPDVLLDGFGFVAAADFPDADAALLVPLVLGRRHEVSRPISTHELAHISTAAWERLPIVAAMLRRAIARETRAERRVLTFADQAMDSVDDDTVRVGMTLLAAVAFHRDQLTELTDNYLAVALPRTPVEELDQLLAQAAVGRMVRGGGELLTDAKSRPLRSLLRRLLGEEQVARLHRSPADPARLDLSAFDLAWTAA